MIHLWASTPLWYILWGLFFHQYAFCTWYSTLSWLKRYNAAGLSMIQCVEFQRFMSRPYIRCLTCLISGQNDPYSLILLDLTNSNLWRILGLFSMMYINWMDHSEVSECNIMCERVPERVCGSTVIGLVSQCYDGILRCYDNDIVLQATITYLQADHKPQILSLKFLI